MLQAATVLVAMAGIKNFGDATKITVKFANLLTFFELLRAKLFPRNYQDFARCVFLVVGVFHLFKTS